MKVNKKVKVEYAPVYNNEGIRAKRVTPLLQLRRSVMACMLWEDNFYEDGQEIAKRIQELIKQTPASKVAQLAIEVRNEGKLRHVPLLIARAMAALPTHREYVADVLTEIIQRPDELAEYIAIYWKDGKQPLSAQSKKGLARAFTKFDEHQLAKYNRDNAVKLRDVLFMCHAKPVDKKQANLWKRLVNDELKTPDTWEVALSASQGENKGDEWSRLLKENKLGALALLKNLRNMKQAGVSDALIRQGLRDMKVERVLPYRFIAAAKFAPNLEPELEQAMFKAVETKGRKIPGKTVLLIDVSPSMDSAISAKSDLKRIDAACGLAILARELFEDVEVFSFSQNTVQVPTRRGFALRDAIKSSQPSNGTLLGKAIREVSNIPYERLIVFTDEESQDPVGNPRSDANSYMINVANTKNGVGYGVWTHVDGFSESVLQYIIDLESLKAD